MSVKIREAIATIRPHWKPVVIRAVKAPNPDRPCIGCALRHQRGCLDEECEELLEYGYQFQEMHGMDADKGRTVRNCDIGTFDDQLARFLDYCNGRSCSECPLLPKKDRGERYACAVAWMGAKYECPKTEHIKLKKRPMEDAGRYFVALSHIAYMLSRPKPDVEAAFRLAADITSYKKPEPPKDEIVIDYNTNPEGGVECTSR